MSAHPPADSLSRDTTFPGDRPEKDGPEDRPEEDRPEKDKPGSAPPPAHKPPDLRPPRSDRVNADDLGSDLGESSSKDTQIDIAPPGNDAKAHPKSAEAVKDAEATADVGSGVDEFHPFDPQKANKDVEVGDFYFKRQNYHAAEDRYREALYYKENDAIATFRLAVCLEKLDRPNDALAEYESYLRILPYGPEAPKAHKAMERIQKSASVELQPK